MKKVGLLLVMLVCLRVVAQQPDSEGSLVKWMKLEEALKLNETNPKPFVVDFYTGWCGWCKKMMATTYANPGLASYINQNFYPVKFDAEGKDTVMYLGKTYEPISDQPRTTHPLAAKLLQGKLMYPTTLFLNNFDKSKNEFQFSLISNGYMEVNKLEPLLIFTLENVFRNSSYEDFSAQFQRAFFDTATNEKLKALKWKTPVEAFSNVSVNKKKTLVFIHTQWCNSCRVMERATFIDDSCKAILDEKFDLVDFNPEISDALSFKGQIFKNPRTPQTPFHELAIALCRNNFALPTLAILDEQMNVLDAVPLYVHPSFLKNIARYYGNDIHQKKNWADFLKEQQP